MFLKTHPIIGSRNIRQSMAFYTGKLGFELAFQDSPTSPNYVGFRRDAVEVHMQFQYEDEMSRIRLRILVEEPESLMEEFLSRGVECTSADVLKTPWGTGEFSLWDPDRNALTFYRHQVEAAGN